MTERPKLTVGDWAFALILLAVLCWLAWPLDSDLGRWMSQVGRADLGPRR